MVIHFYHLWLGGDWKTIADEHFTALRSAEFPGGVRVGLVGSPEARDEAYNWLDRRWNYGIADEATEGFEEVTLHPLHELAYALMPSTPILYAHNKGSFHAGKGFENGPWRREMTEHLVTNWANRVEELTTGCDVSAWRWLPTGTVDPWGGITESPMAAGNFWWARAGYVRKLPALPEVLTEDNRILAEGWLGKHDPHAAGVSTEWPQVEVKFKFVPDGSGMQGSGAWVPA